MAETCAINGSARSSGALAVPLLTPAGCAGVLAIELPHGSEQALAVRAVATIFAAQLAQLIGGVRTPGDEMVANSSDLQARDRPSEPAPLTRRADSQDSASAAL
jgi:hypothetical protein